MKEKQNSIIFEAGIFIFTFLTLVVIVTTILLALGIRISIINIIVASILTFGYTYYRKQNIQESIMIMGIAFTIFAFCVIIASSLYDYSWDGTAYHKAAVGMLKEGWNPIYQTSEQFNSLSQSIPQASEFSLIWPETYPKAAWYLAASIYALTGNVEAGKAFNLLFMFICFSVFYGFFIKKIGNKWVSALIAIIASCNPIAMAQMNRYYIDGLATSILIILIFHLVTYFSIEDEKSKRDFFEILFCIIIWGCNLKYSITAFTGVYCIMFWILTVLYNRKNKINVKGIFCFFSVSSVISICGVGFNPYFTNLLRRQQLFYGFDSQSGMLSSTNLLKSGAFDGLNSFQMLFVSIFSKMSHDNYSTLTEVYKLPFTIHSEELQYYDIPNPYLGGWGSLFGGLFIVSILVILVHTFCKWKERDFQYKASIFYVFFTILLLCILPGTYMARFAGHLYVVVIMATVILLSSLYKKTKLNLIFSKSMAVIMCILIFGNIAPWINTQRKIISESVDINAHISYLHKYEDKNIKLAILNPDYHALAFDMRDQNIHFELVPYDKIDSSYKRFYNWQLYYKVEE